MKFSLKVKRAIGISLIVVLATIAFYILVYRPPRPEIIRITGVNGDSLILKDAGNSPADTFKVDAGKTINWVVNTNDVGDIKNIYKKPNSDSVFIPPPARIGNSRNWTGTVDPGAKGKKEEYSIDWTDSAGGKHTFDPTIQVNP